MSIDFQNFMPYASPVGAFMATGIATVFLVRHVL